jgi:hypothetical protein
VTESQKHEIDALKDLLESRGWQVYREMVLSEIASDFEEHITKALDSPDGILAVDRMRQIAAVRKAGIRWLALPKKRHDTLTQQAGQESEKVPIGRRPHGL